MRNSIKVSYEPTAQEIKDYQEEVEAGFANPPSWWDK